MEHNETEYNKNMERYLAFTFVIAILLMLALIGCGIAFRKNTNGNLNATSAAILLFIVLEVIGKKLLHIKRSGISLPLANRWEWGVCILLFVLALSLQHFLTLPATLSVNLPIAVLCLLFALPYFRCFRNLRRERQR